MKSQNRERKFTKSSLATMLLPPAVEDFLNTSFDPDVEGYEADTR